MADQAPDDAEPILIMADPNDPFPEALFDSFFIPTGNYEAQAFITSLEEYSGESTNLSFEQYDKLVERLNQSWEEWKNELKAEWKRLWEEEGYRFPGHESGQGDREVDPELAKAEWMSFLKDRMDALVPEIAEQYDIKKKAD